MEEQIISWIINYLGEGVLFPVIIFLILYFLKTMHLYFDSILIFISKHQEIKSHEKIEKKKLKAVRKKKKASR
ncbi:hypothetical protein [Algoriphagus sp. Y33]|uniref:hypothetical protein n=1 Tax=Algoriphagus sp. Y33 TaxID=2772483 RepID=UPI001CE0C2A5|nr:hypothetical protein [Algoriphagus sp. Y33]